MKRFVTIFTVLLAVAVQSQAATIATFNTSVGSFQLELFDEEKPITVSNFIKYATSGRYVNQIIHRWQPGFVIQGGAYRVQTEPDLQLVPVPVYGQIRNEFTSDPKFSNLYGTIAMARLPGQVHSASSQWYINLGDNSGLDDIDEGFTVFGRVIQGTNVVNQFIPPPPAFGIYTNFNVVPQSPVPVLSATNLTYNDLLYVQVGLHRDLGLAITKNQAGTKQIAWNSIAGVTNVLEFSTNLTLGTWTTLSNFVGNGTPAIVADPSSDPRRLYRVKLFY